MNDKPATIASSTIIHIHRCQAECNIVPIGDMIDRQENKKAMGQIGGKGSFTFWISIAP